MSPISSHEEFLRKKRKRKIIRLWVGVFLIFFIIAIASYISHRPNIRISKVILNGGVLVEQTEVESESLKYMSGSYFWLFPKNNFLWYPNNKLTAYLKETFKRIDTITIDRKGFDTLVVDITERKPIALWGDALPMSGDVTDREGGNTEHTSARYYFLDSNGTIFAEAPQFSGDAYFKYYGLVSSDNPIGNYYIASSTEFASMTDFVEKVRKLSLKPLYILGKGGGEFSIILSGGGQIYFDTKEPFSKVAENLEALLRTPTISQNILNIDYIDLRYGNKLFYKLK